MHNCIKCVLLMILLIGTSSVKASNLYPEWFLFPGKYQDLHVGYSYSGAPAVHDAEGMYCAFKECLVFGTLEIYENSSVDDLLKNSNYFYYYSPDSLERVQGKLNMVDRFEVNILTRDYISAFSFDPDYEVAAPMITVQNLEQPSWIDQSFMQDKRFYYGIGMYTAIGNENDAWKTAEEQAIFSILTNLAVQVHKVNITAKEYNNGQAASAVEEISMLKLKYLLRNISILERYPDRENRLVYVLARIPIKDVISPMLR